MEASDGDEPGQVTLEYVEDVDSPAPHCEAALQQRTDLEENDAAGASGDSTTAADEHQEVVDTEGEAASAATGRRRVAVVLSDQGVATAVPLHCVVEAGLSQRVLFQDDGQPVILEVLDQADSASPQESEDDPGGGGDRVRAAGARSWLSERTRGVDQHGRLVKTGMWSRDEVETLSNNMDQYCRDRGISNPEDIIFRSSKDERKNFYRTVARGINRPLFAIYRRIIRMYDRKNHVGRYTEEEVEQLRNLRAIHGNKWGTIGAVMGRSAASVKDRVRVLRENRNQGKWLKWEEDRLEQAVYEVTDTEPGQPITTGINWAAVAQKVQTRNEKQCRSKWLNNLSWKATGGLEWTRYDDHHLIETLLTSEVAEESGVNWSSLTESWPRNSVRSPQWLRARWWQLKQQLKQHQHLSFRELLAALAQLRTRDYILLETADGEDAPDEQQQQEEEGQPAPPQQQPCAPLPTPAPEPHHFLHAGTRLFVDQQGRVLPDGSVTVAAQEATFLVEPQQLQLPSYSGAVMIGGQLYAALPPQPTAPLHLPLLNQERVVLERTPAPLLHHPVPAISQPHEAGVALTSESEYPADLGDEPMQEVHLDAAHTSVLDAAHASVIRGDPIMSRTAPGATSEDESIDCPQ